MNDDWTGGTLVTGSRGRGVRCRVHFLILVQIHSRTRTYEHKLACLHMHAYACTISLYCLRYDNVLNFPDTGVADDAVAQELSKKVRILCWIMTAPQYLQAKARHVRATWGRRCNVLLVSKCYPQLAVVVAY